MGESLQQIKNQLNEFWSGLDKGKKTKLVISSLLIVFTITAIIFLTTRTKYVDLYNRQLQPGDTALIIEQLDSMGADWKQGDFNSILVPSDQKTRILGILDNAGILKSSYTFDDYINNLDFTMSQDDKDRLFDQVTQSRLEDAILKLDGIVKAQVLFYRPDDEGLLFNNRKKSNATVVVQTGIGRSLNLNIEAAIKSIVNGGTGIDLENISVVDPYGSVNNQSNFSDDGYNLNGQYTLKHSLEDRFNNSIDEFLETVFGYGNVKVQTTVSINFDNEITTIREFKPPIDGSEEGLIRSLQQIEESTVNSVNGGVPGTESNTGDVTDYAQEDASGSKYDKASKTINYELNEINSQINKAPGAIESITVAVIINQDSITDGELSNEEKGNISKLIYAATGLETKNVVVDVMKFSSTDDQIVVNPTSNQISNALSLQNIGILAVALLGISGLLILLTKRRRKAKEKAELERLIQNKTEEMANIEEIDFDKEKNKVKTEINRIVEKKPEAVAHLLRSWLNED